MIPFHPKMHVCLMWARLPCVRILGAVAAAHIVQLSVLLNNVYHFVLVFNPTKKGVRGAVAVVRFFSARRAHVSIDVFFVL